ncbi:MAG: hypothetical protein CMB80_04370 [Flammeovirgaceae bacterium]|jgi:hypothetical protein|nr:hypothetical protein [Flammeovirgaceae bacterium]|tara:strand:+ start:976 stop:1527 length:552 start_codon:yes stop_codon:yes gene_type:complete
MEISLANLERHSMLFIGSISLTPENPGPICVDVQSLSEKEAFQMMYNIKKGILSVTGDLVPLRNKLAPEKEISGAIETVEKDSNLMKLLNKKIATVRREASDLTPSEQRKLLELEKSHKNRKGLVGFLTNLQSRHLDEVSKNLEKVKENSDKEGLTAQTFLDDLPDVLELEQEEVELTLPDKE